MEEIDIKNIEEDYENNYIETDKEVIKFMKNNEKLEIIVPKFGDIIHSSVTHDITKSSYEKVVENYNSSTLLVNNSISEKNLLEFNDNIKSIDSIKNIDIKQTLKKGKKILDENQFFYDLDKIMSDKKFKNFYEKYFKDIVDIKVILLYMKLYETIQKEYFVIHNTEIDNKLLAYMIKELMNNNMSRSKIMKSFHNFLEGETESKNRNNYKKFLLDFLDKKNK